jgi:shikimate kinase
MNFVFIGYMGSGKTTLGKKVARLMNFNFVDLDQLIVEKSGMSIQELFDKKGESEFRRLEVECLNQISSLNNHIIATGGGTPCFGDNLELLKKIGKVVYIQLSKIELTKRLQESKKNERPLIKGKSNEELLEFVTQHLSSRESFYLNAEIIVKGIEQRANRLAPILQSYL